MYATGFVPWRLRRLATGDPVPEVIPLGLFTWGVETLSCREGAHERARNSYEGRSCAHTRQMRALKRQRLPKDDKETKLLSYAIQLTENCGVYEEEIEMYEFMAPTNNVMYSSLMYRSISSPMAHLLVDYRNLRHTTIRRGYADAWNTQAKMICSYQSAKNLYGVSEGNPITNDWAVPQNRLGLTTDTNLPTEMEQNAYARDSIMETLVSSKLSQHKPMVYTLPKNTKLEVSCPPCIISRTRSCVRRDVDAPLVLPSPSRPSRAASIRTLWK